MISSTQFTEQETNLEYLNRRRKKRIYLYQYLDVFDAEDDTLIGYLSDYSEEGMMFISSQNFAQDIIKSIYIKNCFVEPNVIIHMQIKVVWTRPNINPTMHCTGCYFMQIDAFNRQLLEQIGDSLRFTDDIEINREMLPNNQFNA